MMPFQTDAMEPVFDAFEPEARVALLGFRELVFEVASEIEQVKDVEESLKWGQPSYAPKQ